MIKELYKYRELLKSNIKKDIRGKYKGSFLGILWSFVSPLLSVLVYAIVFPFILKNSQDNYITFLVIGILPWNFFASCINIGATCVIGNAGILKKVYFPREILPISVATSGLINFLISCLIIFLFLLFSGIGFSIFMVFLPLIILVQFILILGLTFIISSINVYIRDAEYIVNFFVTMLFYGTPILYSASLFPERFRWILNLNPMTTIINGYRDILFNQTAPNIFSIIIALIGSLLLLIIGVLIFKKLEKGFAEEL